MTAKVQFKGRKPKDLDSIYDIPIPIDPDTIAAKAKAKAAAEATAWRRPIALIYRFADQNVKWYDTLTATEHSARVISIDAYDSTVDLEFTGSTVEGKWSKEKVPIDANLKSVGGNHNGAQTTEELNKDSADLDAEFR